MTKAAWQEGMHSAGAHHATAWLSGPLGADLTGSEVLTLSVVANLADVDLSPGGPGYFGVTVPVVALAMRAKGAVALRRLERLVEVGALIKRPWVAGMDRYWLPDEVDLPLPACGQ